MTEVPSRRTRVHFLRATPWSSQVGLQCQLIADSDCDIVLYTRCQIKVPPTITVLPSVCPHASVPTGPLYICFGVQTRWAQRCTGRWCRSGTQWRTMWRRPTASPPTTSWTSASASLATGRTWTPSAPRSRRFTGCASRPRGARESRGPGTPWGSTCVPPRRNSPRRYPQQSIAGHNLCCSTALYGPPAQDVAMRALLLCHMLSALQATPMGHNRAPSDQGAPASTRGVLSHVQR